MENGCKVCRKCGETKPLEQFVKSSHCRQGYTHTCKSCDAIYKAEYRARHKEKLSLCDAKRYAENRDQIKAHVSEHYRNHREEKKAYGRRYYAMHKGKVRQYIDVHKEEIAAKNRTRYARQREKRIADALRWAKEHPKQRYLTRRARWARQRKAPGSGLTYAQWQDILEKYGHRCLACGTPANLTMDHVIPLAIGGAHDVTNIQPLCRSCNSSKGVQIVDYRQRGSSEYWEQVPLPEVGFWL